MKKSYSTRFLKTLKAKKTGFILALGMLLNPLFNAHAQTVWNGPVITFSTASGGASADAITSNVSLTRGTTQGLFNSSAESGFTHSESPRGTEWSYGDLANYATLTYTDWETWCGKPVNMLNRPAVVHLVADNIYLQLTFLTWETGHGGDGGFSYTRSTGSSLPVSLKTFSAILKGSQAVLQWTTATEINNKAFEIQHSIDGINFSAVGKVNGSGNSTVEHSYSFTHSNVTGGKNYYRLAQSDFNGVVKYSQIVLISLKSAGQLQIKPNPTTSFITLTASFSIEGAKYFINSSAGQVLQKGVLKSQEVDVHQLLSGQYWITVQPALGDPMKLVFIKK